MFIPRAASISCSATDASCPSDADNSSGFDQSWMDKRGPHRFIGVAMVVGLILIIFLVWLYRGRWPRRMLQQYCCCCRHSKELPEPTDVDETPTQDKSKLGNSDHQLVKEVSAGMVVFTKVPTKALRAKDQHHPVEWEMDHVNGIRLEVLTLSYRIHFSLC
jgi:hypothetical protein